MIQHTCPLMIEKHRKERQIMFHGDFSCNAYANDLNDYPTRSIPLHWHPEMELILPLSDGVRIVSSAEEVRIPPETICFVNKNALHGIVSEHHAECIFHSLVFSSELVGGQHGSVFDRKYIRPLMESGPALFLAKDQKLSDLFRDAFHAMDLESPGYEFLVRSALSEILFSIIRSWSPTETTVASCEREVRMKAMLEWFDLHYAEPFSIQALADSVNYSPRECERTFQSILHTSPKAYLSKRRIMAAIDLIENTTRPLSDIAVQCGFNNQSSFSRQFRKVTGRSPSTYRIASAR